MARFKSKDDFEYTVGCLFILFLVMIIAPIPVAIAVFLEGLTGIRLEVLIIICSFLGIIILYYFYRKGKLDRVLQIFKKK